MTTGPGLAERVLAGEPRAIARALSVVENEPAAGRALVERLRAKTGRAHVIGITGPPGAGKSTLVDGLIAAFRREDRSVAVLAIDPTSPYSGGAVLGDRIRLGAHAADARVFIRSMATRGHLGGLSRAAGAALAVLDAAGFDVVLIETVGVGQDEIDIAELADVTLVVLVPGAGDDVQSMKAGLMEIADVFVVNKADRDGADQLAASIEAAVSLAPEHGWRPPVVKTIATTGSGLPDVVAAAARFQTEQGAVMASRRSRRLAMAAAAERPIGARLDHVGIASEDGAALAAILGDVLGLSASAAEDVAGQQARVSFLGRTGPRLEIVEPLGEDSPLTRFLARRGRALHHLAFRVPDVAAALATLRARGVRLVDESPRPGAGGHLVAFLHPASTGGILIELVGEGGADALG